MLAQVLFCSKKKNKKKRCCTMKESAAALDGCGLLVYAADKKGGDFTFYHCYIGGGR